MVTPAVRTVLLSKSQPGWVLPGGPSLQIDLANRRAKLLYSYYYTEAAIKALFSTFSTPSHYATGNDGILYLIPANSIDSFYMPVGTSWGQLIEEARTNIVLYSNDLINAAWATTNITTAKDQTGPDGVANSASSITATATNGTVLQSVTLNSSARFQTAYVKRLVGTGDVSMTMDGATYTAVTVTSGWTRVSIPTQTIANPTIGFKLALSGDKIAVWCVDNENGTFATSPIVTTSTSVTRAASSIIAADGSAVATAAQQAKAAFMQTYGAAGSGGRFVGFVGGGVAFINSLSTVGLSNGTQTAVAALGSGNYTGTIKSAFGMDASIMTAKANGGATASQASAWSGNTGNLIVGNNSVGNRTLNGYLSQIAFGNTKGQFDNLAVAP